MLSDIGQIRPKAANHTVESNTETAPETAIISKIAELRASTALDQAISDIAAQSQAVTSKIIESVMAQSQQSAVRLIIESAKQVQPSPTDTSEPIKQAAAAPLTITATDAPKAIKQETAPPLTTPAIDTKDTPKDIAQRAYWNYVLNNLAVDLRGMKHYNIETYERFLRSQQKTQSFKDYFEKSGHTPDRTNESNSEYIADLSNKGLDHIFTFCNTTAVVTHLVSHFVFGDSGICNLVASGFNLFWNYYESSDDLLAANDQWRKAQHKEATMSFVSAVMLFASNTAHLLTLPTVHIITGAIGVSLSTIAAPLVFALGVGIDYYFAHKKTVASQERIENLEKKRDTMFNGYSKIRDKQSIPAIEAKAKINGLDNLMASEKTAFLKYKKRRDILGCSRLAMAGISLLSLLAFAHVVALGAASFGLIPVAIAGVAIGIGLYRAHHSNHVPEPEIKAADAPISRNQHSLFHKSEHTAASAQAMESITDSISGHMQTLMGLPSI